MQADRDEDFNTRLASYHAWRKAGRVRGRSRHDVRQGATLLRDLDTDRVLQILSPIVMGVRRSEERRVGKRG